MEQKPVYNTQGWEEKEPHGSWLSREEEDFTAHFGERYRIRQTLRQAPGRTVWRCRRISDNRQYVIKQIDTNRLREPYSEGAVHKQMKHENIVPARQHVEGCGFEYIVMPFFELGSLHRYNPMLDTSTSSNDSNETSTDGRPWTEDEILRIIRQLFQGLDYIHNEQKRTHQDLKCDNIILASQVLLKVQIIDFGLSRPVGTTPIPRYGTLGYGAPECRKGVTNTPALDMWALGIIILELNGYNVGSYAPSNGSMSPNFLRNGRGWLYETDRYYREVYAKLQDPEKFNTLSMQIARALLQPNPIHRLTAKQGLQRYFPDHVTSKSIEHRSTEPNPQGTNRFNHITSGLLSDNVAARRSMQNALATFFRRDSDTYNTPEVKERTKKEIITALQLKMGVEESLVAAEFNAMLEHIWKHRDPNSSYFWDLCST